MTVTSWLRLTISLWLLRKAVKVTGWLLLVVVLAAVWPVTIAARALAKGRLARAPAARTRLWAVAAMDSQAAFAAKTPENEPGGRW